MIIPERQAGTIEWYEPRKDERRRDVFDLGTPIWQIVLRALAVYAAVFVGFRLLGKRELGQMTVFDLVLILLISNAVQNAMVGPDASLQGGLVAAAVLLLANRVAAEARLRSPLVDRLFEGRSAVLVEHGRLVTGQLRKQRVAEVDLEEAMREHGIESLDQVQLAVLETDGTISIVPVTSPTLRSRRGRSRGLRKK
jgi:uncharacterized membrane protein YcaP (DUF421 family)